MPSRSTSKRPSLPVASFLIVLLATAILADVAGAWGNGWSIAAITGRPAEAPSPSVIGIVAVGDIMMGTAWPEGMLPPDDGRDLFRRTARALRDRDVVFGNLEGPLLDNGVANKCDKAPNPKLCFAFRTPTRYGRYLKDAGFNALNIANNHAFDFGREGIDNTVAVLSGLGIQPVGGDHVARIDVGGKRVAILGFSYSHSSPYSASILNIAAAEARIRKAVSENDLVLVSFHGGAEGKDALHLTGEMEMFAGEKRGDVERFAHAAIDAGAAAVLGHGPHVPRAIEIYRGKLIAYSLGNFLGFGRFNLKGASGLGYALRADLDPETGNFLSGRIMPMTLSGRGIPLPDPAGRATRLIRRLSAKDLPTTGAVIRDDGTLCPLPQNVAKAPAASIR
ncbi:MAG TPA: CapA family protein [Candidatus Deferrimicrobiaceae bacterium]|jgi:poly-gamma-glutamate capsule biosynthesis protein CapA/YwtB (metallophosphatase superfamily)